MTEADKGFVIGAEVSGHNPYVNVRISQVGEALLRFDKEVVEGVQRWPVRRNDGVLLTAEFIDEDLPRLHSLVDYLRANRIMQFERIGPKLQAFSADQLRVFMLLGAAAREARGEDAVIPLVPGLISWRCFSRNSFVGVPDAVEYGLGENYLREQIKGRKKIIMSDDVV